MIKRQKKQYSMKKVHWSCISHAMPTSTILWIISALVVTNCTIFFFVPFILRISLAIHRKTTLSGFIFDDLWLSHDYFFFVSYFFHFFLILFIEHSTQIYTLSPIQCLWLFLHAYFFFFGGICRENWKEEKRKEKSNINDTNTCFISIYRDMWAWEQ